MRATLRRREALRSAALAPAILVRRAGAEVDSRPVLRVAVQALPPTLEPVESISNVGLRVTGNVFDTLVRRDFLAEARTGRSRLTPGLATELVQRDPLTWVATLRSGVRLHDGNELGADDVAATFAPDRLWGPKAPFFEGRISFGHLAEVFAEGPGRVVFRTRSPDIALPHRLAAYGGWIGSARYLASAGLDGMRKRPIGTGPYQVSAFERDQRVVLDSHDEYWMGKPPTKRIVLTVVPEASTRLAGLQAGDFDIVTNLLPDQAPALARNTKVEAVSVPMDLVHILYFDTRRPLLGDVRVRQALNHAIDYDLLGRALWGDDFQRMAALQIPAFGDLYDHGRIGFAYDPDKARKLLAAADWKPQPIVIRIPSGYYLNLLQAVQVVQEMWQAVGVPSRLEIRENLALVAEPGADVRPSSVAFRFADPLGGGLMVHFARDYFIQAQGYWQPTRFNALSDEFRVATGPAERRRLWRHLLDEYEAEAPAVILYPVREIFGKLRNISFTHYPLYYLDFRNYNLTFT